MANLQYGFSWFCNMAWRFAIIYAIRLFLISSCLALFWKKIYNAVYIVRWNIISAIINQLGSGLFQNMNAKLIMPLWGQSGHTGCILWYMLLHAAYCYYVFTYVSCMLPIWNFCNIEPMDLNFLMNNLNCSKAADYFSNLRVANLSLV